LWDFFKGKDNGRERSSHKLVELKSNGKITKSIRDWQFIFIDKEM
jgi:hypothetical protein